MFDKVMESKIRFYHPCFPPILKAHLIWQQTVIKALNQKDSVWQLSET